MLNGINNGWGVSYVRVGDQSAWESNRTKLILMTPLYGCIAACAAEAGVETGLSKVQRVRGFIYGSFIGYPVGLALDAVASVTTQLANVILNCGK